VINLLLLILSVVLFLFFGSIGFIYSILHRLLRSVGNYFWQIAVAIDELGNTVCQDLFNNIMRKRGGYRFGNSNETVSYVLGVLKQEDKLLPIGGFVSWLLNKIDKHHVEDAVKNKS
jgi:hypothetical protein